MDTDGSPPLWRAGRGGAEVHIFGGRPPLSIPWTAPRVEMVLAQATEYWHETPEVTPETQALAFAHGIDQSRPLESFLPRDLQERVASTAATLAVPPAVIAPMRPWLAAQVLRTVSESKRGLDRASGPESVLVARAAAAGLPIRTEFPTAAAVMEFFGALPQQAEVEMLALELDEIAADPSEERRRAELWLRGDLSYEEEQAIRVQRVYPSFYEHLAVERNLAWVPRIEHMLREGVRAFIVVGIGHMVGSGSLVECLATAGVQVERVDSQVR